MSVIKMQKIRKWVVACLTFTVLLTSLHIHEYITFAYEAQPGMIVTTSSSLVETKKEPSDSAAKARGFVYGKPVTVIGEVTDDKGALWYEIQYTLKSTGATETSFCHAENVLLDKDCTSIRIGVVTKDNVTMYEDADTVTKALLTLNSNTEVLLLQTTSEDGISWQRVRYVKDDVTYVGWIQANSVKFSRYDVELDLEYTEYLKAIGFPESYVDDLAILHAIYPAWVFEPVVVGLDWETVIKAESTPKYNLVSINADDAMKTMYSTEYIWQENRWIPRDSGKWVTAHPEYIAHIMDPRNFLNENDIFQFESLSFSMAHTADGVKAIFGSSFLSRPATEPDGSTLDYAEALMSIGQEVNVSPYHLASRVLQEQGSKGTSVLISGTYSSYPGYFNYFNYGASGDSSDEVVYNGMKFAYNQGWNSRYKSLLGGASRLAAGYIAVGQDTLYFQKFDVIKDGGLYSHQYMQNLLAALHEGRSIARAYSDKQQAFVFRIPVYDNMPEEAVPFNVTGNRNNYLKDLSLDGLSLTPTFVGDTMDYTLIVNSAISSINVTATPVVDKSTVSGTGSYSLQEGTNTIKIVCTSESGHERVYTIKVVREAAQEPNPDTPGTDNPGTDNPGTDNPGTDTPGTDTPDTENPGTDTPGTDTPGTEEPGTDEPGTEEPTPPVIPAEIKSDKYAIGEYITKVQPSTSAADFLSGFVMVGNASVKLLDSKGAVNTGTVGTGNVLQVYDGTELIATYEILIYGDVNGDGLIKMNDLLSINRHVIGTVKLQGVYLKAGDVNKQNDGVKMSDLLAVNRHVIGTVLIEQ